MATAAFVATVLARTPPLGDWKVRVSYLPEDPTKLALLVEGKGKVWRDWSAELRESPGLRPGCCCFPCGFTTGRRSS
jgi:hypothetical protein